MQFKQFLVEKQNTAGFNGEIYRDEDCFIINGVVVRAYQWLADSFNEENALYFYDLVWQQGLIPEPFILTRIEVNGCSDGKKVTVDYFIETPQTNRNTGLPKEWYIMCLGVDERIFAGSPERVRSALLRPERKNCVSCFNGLPIETQWRVIDWISQRIRPIKTASRHINEGSYRLKHILEADTDIYLLETLFLEAMLFCGYMPYETYTHGGYLGGNFKISAKFEPYTPPAVIGLEECQAILDRIVIQQLKIIEDTKTVQSKNVTIAKLQQEIQDLKTQLKSCKARTTTNTSRKPKPSREPKPSSYVYKKASSLKQHVYIFEMSNGTIKIGISRDVKTRASNLRTGSGLEILRACYTKAKTETARSLEEKMHEIFKAERTIGEYFTTKFELAREALEKEVPIIDEQFEFNCP